MKSFSSNAVEHEVNFAKREWNRLQTIGVQTSMFAWKTGGGGGVVTWNWNDQQNIRESPRYVTCEMSPTRHKVKR